MDAAQDGGGRRGWIVVAGAGLAMFVGFGSLYMFGVFFEPIASELGTTRAATAWILSVSSASFLVLGVVAGGAADRVGAAAVIAFGGVAVAAGLIGASRAQAIWQLYLTQGLGVGVGIACISVPALSAVGLWFEPGRRALATGIAVAGSGAGQFAYSPIARGLIDAFGWRQALWILGVAGGCVAVACSTVMQAREGSAVHGSTLRQALGTREFRLLWLAGAVVAFAFLLPQAHLVPYARDRGVSPVAAAFLLATLGAANTLGRFVLGAAAGRLGHRRAFAAAILGMGLAQAWWLAADGVGSLVLFAVVYGTCQGGYIALMPVVAADYFGTARLAGVIGALYTAGAIGSLAGPPAAGAAYDQLGSYTPAIMVGVVACLAGFAILLRLREPGHLAGTSPRPDPSGTG